jgi:hypothetical protein
MKDFGMNDDEMRISQSSNLKVDHSTISIAHSKISQLQVVFATVRDQEQERAQEPEWEPEAERARVPDQPAATFVRALNWLAVVALAMLS